METINTIKDLVAGSIDAIVTVIGVIVAAILQSKHLIKKLKK